MQTFRKFCESFNFSDNFYAGEYCFAWQKLRMEQYSNLRSHYHQQSIGSKFYNEKLDSKRPVNSSLFLLLKFFCNKTIKVGSFFEWKEALWIADLLAEEILLKFNRLEDMKFSKYMSEIRRKYKNATSRAFSFHSKPSKKFVIIPLQIYWTIFPRNENRKKKHDIPRLNW